MSTKGKIIFGLSCLTSAIVIYQVHAYQQEERNVCV